jgi:hypothetical protein
VQGMSRRHHLQDAEAVHGPRWRQGSRDQVQLPVRGVLLRQQPGDGAVSAGVRELGIPSTGDGAHECDAFGSWRR